MLSQRSSNVARDTQVEAEREKQSLLQLQAESSAVQSMGKAKAEARARAEAAQIEYEAELTQAELRVKAKKIQDQYTSFPRAPCSLSRVIFSLLGEPAGSRLLLTMGITTKDAIDADVDAPSMVSMLLQLFSQSV